VARHQSRAAGIRFRTAALAASVVAVALAVAGGLLLVLLRDRLVGAEMSAASLRSRDIAVLVADGELPDDLSFPGDDLGFSQVVTADGTVVAASGNVAGEPPQTDRQPPTGTSLEAIRTGLPVGDGERFAISVRTVASSDGPLTVIAGSSLAAADDTWSSVLLIMLVGVPALVVLVVAVARRVVNTALRPVEAIRSEVAEISQHDLHKRVPEPGTGDEIDRLAASMNSMLERLENSSEQQRRFVADASHELRSPLASARATLEVSAAHSQDIAALRSAIDDALTDHDRLEALLADLLALARLDDPSASAGYRPVDMNEVATRAFGQYSDTRIHLDVAHEPQVVIGNPSQLDRVLTNLIDNALTYCEERVRVRVASDRAHAILTVDDDGPGIAPSDRDRVFGRFVRLDEARTSDRGTGLGLAIVRDTVRSHNGSVRVETGPLGGALLEVRLPRE
jgi:signal transduction histidine kinase